ncbi:FAD-dependent oxidoreductase [Vulcanisaeta thermophila]|uniref:FAD-dependent oxidoreductase n=1 Tax=Vulcanisaeta thermophila TaxID=867917 RepID=UPI000852D1BC|nr:FAD-dependent oxidoreductase [Vulcanisaeta thermophila]
MKFALKCSPGQKIERRSEKVAIIGAGPAGLGAAGYLICKGFQVDVYDKLPEPGGLMIFGIPEYRVPKKNVRAGVKELIDLGVNFILKTKVVTDDEEHVDGDDFVERRVHLEELINKYDAVLIATGTWKSRTLEVPGENLKGVYLALDYLYRIYTSELGYLPKSVVYPVGDRVAVVGAGLTAVDAAIEAQRQGAKEVYVLYRRTINEAPAGKMEIQNLIKRGIKFVELVGITEILGKDHVEAVRLIKMRLGKPDRSGRPAPEPIPGSEYVMEMDNVIAAVGEIPTPPFKRECCGIKLTPRGTIDIDQKHRTTRPKVFAAGDVATGPSLIGKALKNGIDAAMAIEEYLTKGGWRQV